MHFNIIINNNVYNVYVPLCSAPPAKYLRKSTFETLRRRESESKAYRRSKIPTRMRAVFFIFLSLYVLTVGLRPGY
jgi:hypothetical protein